MNQLIAVIVAFLFIPVLIKLKFKLSYTLLISTAILGALSGLDLSILTDAVYSIVNKPASSSTILTILMVAILGVLMKHYGIIDEIIKTMSLIISDKRKVIAITPALMGVLIMPGGALLSAPFVYELGQEMNIKPSKSAAINLVFRHLAMFLFPYSTSLLVISATMPDLNIFKLILLNSAFVFGIIALGYFYLLKDIEVEKSTPTKKVKQNFTKLIILTSPIYICIILNLLTGLPFYITLIGSVFMVYILGSKENFLHVLLGAFNKNTLMTLLTVTAILIMKEIVMSMEDLFKILHSLIIASQSNILTTMLFFIGASFILGYITGLDTTALAIVLPFIYQFNILGKLVYVYTYFIYGASFLGYYFSPLHLCQAFTLERMGVYTNELYKEYKFYAPSLVLYLIVTTVIFQLILQ